MNTASRNGFKWSVNEILALQREFELLNWDINAIAEKHQRTPNAIMFKLDDEGFADYNVLYSNYHSLNSPIPVERKNEIELNYETSSVKDEVDNVVYHKKSKVSSSTFKKPTTHSEPAYCSY